MKKIKTSDIVGGAGMPIKQGTLNHLQDAYKECIEAIVRSRIGDNYDATKSYLLYGLKRTGSGLVFNVTAGAIFFNGEIYLVDAFNFTATSGQTAVGTITTTNVIAANADPVTFKDGVDHNVHEIRKIVFASAVAGAGDIDFVNIVTYIEEKDFIDITSTVNVSSKITVIDKKMRRYKDGRIDLFIDGTINTTIFAPEEYISGLPFTSRVLYFFCIVRTSSPSVDPKASVLTGSGIQNIETLTATWAYQLYFTYYVD